MTVALAPTTLADAIPLPRLRSTSVVLAGTALTAIAAQVRIPLGFTPVPITAQTFAVLLVAGVSGARRAAGSQALYWALGAVGVPVFANWKGGWSAATGATAGYVAGFVVASVLVGLLSERGQDRSLLTAVPQMLLGSTVIYTMGVLWLAHTLNVPVYSGEGTDALSLGLTPFVVGDLLKLFAAALIMPMMWRLAGRFGVRPQR